LRGEKGTILLFLSAASKQRVHPKRETHRLFSFPTPQQGRERKKRRRLVYTARAREKRERKEIFETEITKSSTTTWVWAEKELKNVNFKMSHVGKKGKKKGEGSASIFGRKRESGANANHLYSVNVTKREKKGREVRGTYRIHVLLPLFYKKEYN